MLRTSRPEPTRPAPSGSSDFRRTRGYAEAAWRLVELAPNLPPPLLSGGLRLSHRLHEVLGDRPVEASLWEELLALRRGPGCDTFLAAPLPPRDVPEDLLLERAVEARALVDAVRNNRHAHAGQPLDRILRQGTLRTRRVAVAGADVPVAFRLGFRYAVVGVGEEHPRALRDRIEAAFLAGAREVGTFRAHRITAPLLVAVDPVPFAWSMHLHRLGLQGPWLSWSNTSDGRPMGVLAAHHLVLEGPGIAALRSDFRQRVRAMRTALGMDAIDEAFPTEESFGPFDSEPFRYFGPGAGEGVRPSSRELSPQEAELLARLRDLEAEEQADLPRRRSFAFDPEDPPARPARVAVPPGLPRSLEPLLLRPPFARLPHDVRHEMKPPSVRYATVDRGAFSLPDFCYAFCRAQHEALAAFHPRYAGQGFTFIVPHVPAPGVKGSARRGTPVLCSFRARRGAPEDVGPFRRRLLRRLDEADRGRDLLSRVLDDVLRAALPGVVKSLAVRVFEHGLGDGGTFLAGSGLVHHIEIADSLVDPIAQHAGLYEGHFGGSCQDRGGISLGAVDRGYRRDLCAVGTGIFRAREPMDLFWHRFAELLGEAAM